MMENGPVIPPSFEFTITLQMNYLSLMLQKTINTNLIVLVVPNPTDQVCQTFIKKTI